jgi:hypothetical protein
VAKTVYDVVEIELQDGSVVVLRPLNIKSLRKFMDIIGEMQGLTDETEAMAKMVDACALALQKQLPELAADHDQLEEVLDLPTIWKILEVAGGIKLDPNQLAAPIEVGKT